MADVHVEMDKVYPPSTPAIVYITAPARSSLSDMKYKCLYLVAVILDMIETIVAGIGIVIALFLLQSVFKPVTPGPASMSDAFNSNNFNSNNFNSNNFNSNSLNSDPTLEDWDNGALWGIRIFLVVILVSYIQIQLWGWRGFRDHDTCAIYAFATSKILSTLLLLAVLCLAGSSLWTLFNFLISLTSAIVSFLFAQEVSKL